ncbi:MAG TPA: hypothetical protein QGF95_03790, partial [Candidatus Latescibacteria bacterium]|nr:hypothetical protein [Candidatus Latescibacterota bacterium]
RSRPVACHGYMRTEDFSKPIAAIANSFTQFVPGHAHLHPVGQQVKRVIDVELAQVILMWTLLSTNEKAQILAVAREQTAAA